MSPRWDNECHSAEIIPLTSRLGTQMRYYITSPEHTEELHRRHFALREFFFDSRFVEANQTTWMEKKRDRVADICNAIVPV